MLTVAVRMTGDASSLKTEAGAGAAAVSGVGAAATETAQVVQRSGTASAQAVAQIGATAQATAQRVQAVAQAQAAATQAMNTYGLAGIKTSNQLAAEAAAAAQAATQEAAAVQRAKESEAATIWAAAEREAAAVQRFKDALDPLAATQRKVSEETAHLQRWLAQGAITPEQYQQGVTGLERELAKLGGTAGVSAGQMSMAKRTVVMNLMDMAQVTAATGGDLRMLAAIAPDLFYGFRLMGGSIAAAATGFVALGIAIGGIAYAATAFSSDQRAIQHAIDQTGGAVGLSRVQFNDLAKTVAQSTGQSISSVRNYAAAAAASGQVAGAAIGQLAAATRDWADLMDKDVDAAAADLTAMLADPTKAMDTLAGRFHNVSAGARDYVRSLQESGRLGDAQVEVLNRISNAADGASKKVGPLAQFWREFSQGFSDSIDKMGATMAGGPQTTGDEVKQWQTLLQANPDDAIYRRKLSDALQRQAADQARGVVRQQQSAANDNALAADAIYRQSIDPSNGRQTLANQRDLFANAIAGMESQVGPRTDAQEKQLAALRQGLQATKGAYEGFLTEGQKAQGMARLNAQAIGMEASSRAVWLAREQKALELSNSLLAPEEKARQIAAAGAAAQAQQALARQVNIEKMALEASAAERLSNAVGGGVEATQAAERANYLAAEAAAGGAQRLDELAAAYDRVQAAKRAQADTDMLKGKVEEFQAAQMLADAQGKGAAAMAEANIQVQRAALLAKGYSVETVNAAVAVMRLTEAEKVRGNLAAIDKDQSRTLEQLQLELSLVGATTQERERQLALLELRHKLEDAGVQDVEAELQARMAVSDAIAAKRAELSKAQEAAREWQKLWEHAAEKIQDALAGAFKSALSGGVNSFSDFRRTIIDLIKEMAAQIAAMLVFRPVMGGVVSALGLGGSVAGQAMAGGSGTMADAQNAGASIATQAGGSFDYFGAAGLGAKLYGGGSGGLTSAINNWGASNLGLASGAAASAVTTSGEIVSIAGTMTAADGTMMAVTTAGDIVPIAGTMAADAGMTLSTALGIGGLVLGNVLAWSQSPTMGLATTGGTAVGAAIGSVIPGVGTLLGAGIGAAAGGLLGGLFGGGGGQPKEGRVPGVAYSGINLSGGKFVQGNVISVGDSLAPAPQISDAASQFLAGLNKAVELLGLTVSGGDRVVGALAAGWVDNPNHGPERASYGGRSRIFTDPEAAAVALLKDPEVIAATGMVSTALRNSVATTLKDLGADVEFAQALERTKAALAGVSDVLGDLRKAAEASTLSGLKPMLEAMQKAQDLGLKADWVAVQETSVRKQFSDLAPQDQPTQTEQTIAKLQGQLSGLKEIVSRLGLNITAAEIDGYQQSALAKIKQGFDTSIADQLLQLTDPNQLALRQWQEWGDNLRKEAQAAGADMVKVEELIAQKRLAILKDEQAALTRAGTAIKDWLEKQLLGDLSSLSAPAKLTEAQSQFNATVNAARGGDADALAALTGKADAVLTLARDMFASTADYTSMEQWVRSTVHQVAHDAGVPGFAIGTSSAPGGLAWVGERGKELVQLPAGARVLPSPQSMALANGMGSGTELREVVRQQMLQSTEMRALRREMAETSQRMERTLSAVERLSRKVAS